MAARKIAFNSAPVMDELTIAVNGPFHFDDYVSVINSRIENAAMDFDMVNYNSLSNEMHKFNLRPSIILDAPIELELPNHGWAHIPAKEMEKVVEMDNDEIDEFFEEFDKAHPISDEMESEFSPEEFDCIEA